MPEIERIFGGISKIASTIRRLWGVVEPVVVEIWERIPDLGEGSKTSVNEEETDDDLDAEEEPGPLGTNRYGEIVGGRKPRKEWL